MMTFLNDSSMGMFPLLKRCLVLLLFLSVSTGVIYAEEEGKATPSKGQSIKAVLENSGVTGIEAKYLPTAEKSESPKAALADTIQAFTNVISGFAAGIAILFIVINAGKLIMAVGGSDEITKAKKNIVWAGVGLLLVMFAFVLAKTVISITFSGDFA